MNPMLDTGAKMPDQWAPPSTAKHLEYELQCTPVLDATSGYYYVGLCITNCLGANYQKLTASAAGAFTWSGFTAAPQWSALSAFIDRLRLVSALLRLENGTAAASLSGRAYAVQSTSSSATVKGPTNMTDLVANGTRVRSFQLNDLNVTPCCRYIPFSNNTASGAVATGATPDEWDNMGDTAPVVGLAIVCQLPVNTAADFVFRVYLNLEFVPLLAAQYVIPTNLQVAMPNDAAVARRKLLQHEESWEGDLETAVRDTAKLARSVAKTIGSVGKIGANLWAGITGGFSGLTAKRQAYQAAVASLSQYVDPGDKEHLEMIRGLTHVRDSARRAELRGYERPRMVISEEEEKESPRSNFSVVSMRRK